jgi:hypothetical protein
MHAHAHTRAAGLVAAALAFASLAASARASATEARPVTLHQTAERVEGRCTYRTVLSGSWTVANVGAAERATDAVITVDSTVTCRGEAPRSASHQLFFASASEAQIMARIGEVAAMTAQVTSRRNVTFAPTIVREGDSARVAEIRCDVTPTDNATAHVERALAHSRR